MTPDGDAGDPGMTPDQLPQAWRRFIARLEEHRDHPARSCFVGVGNGDFEDDHAVRGLPAPSLIYRFWQADWAAYIWEGDEGWFVRPWQRTRGRVSNAITRVGSLRAALDVLRQVPRPWWRLWG
jgi:hypothetical protein